MNSKIALSGLSILSALTLMTGTAFAAFTDTANANGNTLSTGNVDLTISTDNITYTDSISNFFVGSGIFPGDVRTYTFYLKNNSTSDTPLNINVGFNDTGSDGTLASLLTTQFACNNGATPPAFSVASMYGGSVSLGSLAAGAAMTCTMTVTLPSSADNSVQNKSVTFNGLFNASN